MPNADASSRPRLGVLAGGGGLPRAIAECAAARGTAVHIVAIDSEANADFGAFPVTRVGWGSLGKTLRVLAAECGGRVVIAGGVRRPDPLTIRPDLGLLRNLPRVLRLITAGGDDAVLTRAVRILEANGMTVVGVQDVAPELLAAAGQLGAIAMAGQAETDTRTALALIEAMGPFDVGQAVVVAGGVVRAIEGAEGTDQMLARLVGQADRRGGVLVKAPKPHQELRVDMPTIGPDTIARAAAAGLGGIAVAAGRTLLLERARTLAAADAAGLFVAGFEVTPRQSVAALAAPSDPPRFQLLGRHRPASAAAGADALYGAALSTRLADFATGAGLVVERRHVIAIAATETPAELVARIADVRQWGGRGRGRRGVLVLRGDPASAAISDAVPRAADAGLAGLVLLATAPGALAAPALARADHAGLFMIARAMPAAALQPPRP